MLVIAKLGDITHANAKAQRMYLEESRRSIDEAHDPNLLKEQLKILEMMSSVRNFLFKVLSPDASWSRMIESKKSPGASFLSRRRDQR